MFRVLAITLAACALLAVAGVGARAVSDGEQALAVSAPSCEQSVSEALLSNRIVGARQSYAKDNPAEYAAVRAYLDGGARPDTASMTHMGLHLVYLEDTCRASDVTTTVTSTGSTTTTTTQPPTTTTTTTTTTTPPPTTTTTTTTTTPPPPPSGASLYLSPSGSDANACTQAAPCRSFERAYALAQLGAVVSVGSGVYPAQNFAGGYQASQPAGTKPITFRGEIGNLVRQLHVGSPNITFDGIHVDAGGSKTVGAAFESGGNVTFKNGSIGNVIDEKGALVAGSNFTFDNVRFHDVVLVTEGVHNECVYAIGVPSMTVRNSTFTNCATMDLFFTYGSWWSPKPPTYGNVTLEGNQFGASRFANGACCHYYGLYIGWIADPPPGELTGWAIRNNWFENDVSVSPSVGQGNVFCGNTGQAPTAWKAAC